MRDGPADWHGVLGPECTSRVPIAPRGEGRRGGGLLTSENPRHGRSRLHGARDRARTGVGRAGRGAAAGPGRTPEGTRPRGCRCRVGGSRGVVCCFGEGAVEERSLGVLLRKQRPASSLVPRTGRGAFSVPHAGQVGGTVCPRAASPGERSVPVLRPCASTAGIPASAKIANCFSGTCTASVAVPYPGQGALSAAITLQTSACFTERTHSRSAEFQLLASTSTSTAGHASSDIMCQSPGPPENLEQDFLNCCFLFRLYVPAWRCCPIDSCNKHPLKLRDCL